MSIRITLTIKIMISSKNYIKLKSWIHPADLGDSLFQLQIIYLTFTNHVNLV